ncbi:Uncharacterised protein [Candidatus Gugararchaeum adminiculabundum]|nr:Uncharacterised protein [Candidatus Gugararchaeum adminiculabundum]
MGKGQTAIEVLIISGLLIVILMFIQVRVVEKHALVIESKYEQEGRRISGIVASEINSAATPGYYDRFYLYYFDQALFNVTVYEGFVTVNYSGGEFNSIIRPGILRYGNGSIGTPFNLTADSWYNITNNDGVIVIAKTT